jgi:HEAT repeat protein
MGDQDQTAPADLTSADYRRRMQAIYRLVEQHPPQAGSWIRPLLKDREALVRSAAIVALGDLQDQDALADLVACLAAATTHEQSNAVRALVALGGERMHDPLLQALSQKTDPFVCFGIIKGLSTFADDGEVIDALIQQLQAPDEDVRATAAVALAKMRTHAAVPALQHMMQTDTNQETSIHGLWVANSSVAKMAIATILSGQQASELDWPS